MASILTVTTVAVGQDLRLTPIQSQPPRPSRDQRAPKNLAVEVPEAGTSGPARLVTISATTPLVSGASGLPGDFLLTNGIVNFVISGPGNIVGNSVSGGYVSDAWPTGGALDALGQLHLYLNDQYPRMARYREIQALKTLPGRPGSVAVVARGVDSYESTNDITTTYVLSPGARSLEITTDWTAGPTISGDFSIGDAFAWGQSQQFVPGAGYGSGRRFDAEWIGGATEGVAYGYVVPGKERIGGRTGSTWANPIVTSSTITQGTPLRAVRHLIVADDLGGIASEAARLQGQATYPLEVQVTEGEGQAPSETVRVDLFRDGLPVAQLAVANGRTVRQLPAGNYGLVVRDRLRTSVDSTTVVRTLPQDRPEPANFQVVAPARLLVDLKNSATGTRELGRIKFLGRNSTPNPDLGPVHSRLAMNMAYIVTETDRQVLVPAGDYEIVASRGIEFDMTTGTVQLETGKTYRLEASLRPVPFPFNGVRADFHLHMKNSFDSAVSLEDRVISCVGEGLDLIVATDHNFITDLAPVIRKLGLQSRVTSIIGNEITTRRHFFGHFNAFPLEVQPNKPGNGVSVYDKVTAAQLLEGAASAPGDQVIQVNHPRASDIGYFNRVQMSESDGVTTHPNWSHRFTAIEVFNGKRTDEVEETMKDWLNLVNIGFRYAGTGNSDSHKVADAEPGYPRNYVNLPNKPRDPKALAAAVIAAVNERSDLFATNGPLIQVTPVDAKVLTEKESAHGGNRQIHQFGTAPRLRVTVHGANFVQPDRIQVWRNGTLESTTTLQPTAGSLKFEGILDLAPLDKDSHVVILVDGKTSMEPILTPLIEGRLRIEPTPLAFTNPLWIDGDQDGKWTAPLARHLPMMTEDRSQTALKQLDRLSSQSLVRNQFLRRRAPGRVGEN